VVETIVRSPAKLSSQGLKNKTILSRWVGDLSSLRALHSFTLPCSDSQIILSGRNSVCAILLSLVIFWLQHNIP